MATRSYRYPCCLGHGAERVCGAHGDEGIFVGWLPSGIERKVQFVRVYGLAPRGEALQLAPELLDPLRRHCLVCRGSGWFGEEGDAAPVICPGCDGTGGFWTRPIDEVAVARDQLLRLNPELATRWEVGASRVEGA